ncbi:MAG: ABC transporter permease subunit, partial [Clostridia bacterium]|nr:ABC transporter permease subunit [Clostridia bacterium]
WTAIYKRELRAFFTTPIGYIFVGIFLSVSGGVFCYTTLFAMTCDVTAYFATMLECFVVLLPLLTMKSFSEEKKQKTEQLLLTSPVTLPGMVLGKFLAAYTVFAGSLLFGCLAFVILSWFGKIKIAILFGNILALLLSGMAFIAIGIFVSSVTESQLASAVATIAALAVLMVISLLCDYIGSYPVRFVIESLSVFYRFQNFAAGFFDFAALFYYLSVSFLFLFMTVRVFDKRRYR